MYGRNFCPRDKLGRRYTNSTHVDAENTQPAAAVKNRSWHHCW